MGAMTHDVVGRGSTGGLLLALLSAGSFGLSGSLATELMASGWSAGAAVTARVTLAAAVLLIPALLALRGRWSLLKPAIGRILAYGALAVAGCQLAYFLAVQQMAVGVALLIEYTAPIAVLLWWWLAKGARPSRMTLIGAAVALIGLILVLDLTSGSRVNAAGVGWALLAMAGAAAYFVMSSDESHGLPPIVLAAGGLLVGAVGLGLAGLLGLVPMAASTASPVYRGMAVPWWLPVAVLGVVTAGIAYVTGIAAARRLGSRLASFVALSEVLAAVAAAWLLLGQLPAAIQLGGGLLILAGVVVVKLGEIPEIPEIPETPEARELSVPPTPPTPPKAPMLAQLSSRSNAG
jgi:drug/metabolite transporter (DMT)-like permease